MLSIKILKKVIFYIVLSILFIPNLIFILIGPGELFNELFKTKDYLLPAILNIIGILYCVYYIYIKKAEEKEENYSNNFKNQLNIIKTLNFLSKYDFNNLDCIKDIYFNGIEIYIKINISDVVISDIFDFNYNISEENDLKILDDIINDTIHSNLYSKYQNLWISHILSEYYIKKRIK